MAAEPVYTVEEARALLPQVRAMRQRVISLIPPKQTDRDIHAAIAGGFRDEGVAL